MISYEPFEKLILALNEGGLVTESKKLDYLLHKVAWTTGSELLGDIGGEITDIDSNALQLSSKTKAVMKECLRMVEQVWPGFSK